MHPLEFTIDLLRDKMGMTGRVVVEAPPMQERSIKFREVTNAQMKTSLLYIRRNIVPALVNTFAHSLVGNTQIRNPQEIEADSISALAKLLQQWCISPTRESRFERIVLSSLGKLAQSAQHNPPGLERRLVRRKRRKPRRYKVGIHEFAALHFLREKALNICRLSRPIRPRDNEQVRHDANASGSPPDGQRPFTTFPFRKRRAVSY